MVLLQTCDIPDSAPLLNQFGGQTSLGQTSSWCQCGWEVSFWPKLVFQDISVNLFWWKFPQNLASDIMGSRFYSPCPWSPLGRRRGCGSRRVGDTLERIPRSRVGSRVLRLWAIAAHSGVGRGTWLAAHALTESTCAVFWIELPDNASMILI